MSERRNPGSRSARFPGTPGRRGDVPNLDVHHKLAVIAGPQQGDASDHRLPEIKHPIAHHHTTSITPAEMRRRRLLQSGSAAYVQGFNRSCGGCARIFVARLDSVGSSARSRSVLSHGRGLSRRALRGSTRNQLKQVPTQQNAGTQRPLIDAAKRDELNCMRRGPGATDLTAFDHRLRRVLAVLHRHPGRRAVLRSTRHRVRVRDRVARRA